MQPLDTTRESMDINKCKHSKKALESSINEARLFGPSGEQLFELSFAVHLFNNVRSTD